MRIEEILQAAKISYIDKGHHHCRPGWVQLDCPFCGGGGSKFHLGYNVSGGYFNCWKCGFLPKSRVFKQLKIVAPTTIDLVQDTYARERASTLSEPKGRGPLEQAHIRYLKKRGFDPEELVQLWGIEGLGIVPRLSWRIYIPITKDGVRVSWTTRAIGSRISRRYISASAKEEVINHKHLIYGLEYCMNSIVIVEGPLDAWAIGPGAGALFGTSFSMAQVRELIKIPNRYICFDSTPQAQERAEELANQLSCFAGNTENVILDAKDPGEASGSELKMLRKAARIA
jgi:hypothetical protein